MTVWSNKSLQPTRDGAGSSAIAGGAFWPRVAELWRWHEKPPHPGPLPLGGGEGESLEVRPTPKMTGKRMRL